ncbi:hypothetical protein [Achromobacter dolens]|uniref:hypothetical protein n=1 Tax=Achromobacter dolens TaxID=1287738 RepID=UPI000AACE89F|nr:hypothetical protein [Achromobacter dolens]
MLVIREGWINDALGVMRSLSVEVAFYLLFPLAALLARRLLGRCGRDCYEIYLPHLLVPGLLRTWLPPTQYVGDARLGLLLASVVGACLLGALVSRACSTPLNLRLRRPWRLGRGLR